MNSFNAQEILANINKYGLSKTEKELLKFMLVRTVVPMIKGVPGSGKSAMVHNIAKKLGFSLKIISLSTCDEVDLGVMPKVDKNDNGLYVAKSVYPEWCIEANEETTGCIILFEELYTFYANKINWSDHKVKNISIPISRGNSGDSGYSGNNIDDRDSD